MTELPTLAIIGPGKVGTAIGILAHSRGYSIAAIGGRNQARAEDAARRMGGPPACSPRQAAGMGNLVLLTVPDGAIEGLCDELAAVRAFAPGTVVAHCSGALDSTVLLPAREECGCAIASAHPLQTFPTVEAAVGRLPGAYWFCEGDESALLIVERWAAVLGAASVARLLPGDKAAYHAAAVLACNDLVALLDAALTAGELAGIQRGQAMIALKPLINATLDNVEALGTEKALTGPIARGDIGTVRRHLTALAADPDILDVYRALGRRTVSIALRKGSIDQIMAEQLRDVLS